VYWVMIYILLFKFIPIKYYVKEGMEKNIKMKLIRIERKIIRSFDRCYLILI
jgi:hypothetical protein